MVESVGVGVAGVGAGDDLGGDRSSVAREIAFQFVEEWGKGLEGC